MKKTTLKAIWEKYGKGATVMHQNWQKGQYLVLEAPIGDSSYAGIYCNNIPNNTHPPQAMLQHDTVGATWTRLATVKTLVEAYFTSTDNMVMNSCCFENEKQAKDHAKKNKLSILGLKEIEIEVYEE